MEKAPGERIQDQVVNAVGQVGARITDFLSGNPLETEVGKMIGEDFEMLIILIVCVRPFKLLQLMRMLIKRKIGV